MFGSVKKYEHMIQIGYKQFQCSFQASVVHSETMPLTLLQAQASAAGPAATFDERRARLQVHWSAAALEPRSSSSCTTARPLLSTSHLDPAPTSLPPCWCWACTADPCAACAASVWQGGTCATRPFGLYPTDCLCTASWVHTVHGVHGRNLSSRAQCSRAYASCLCALPFVGR